MITVLHVIESLEIGGAEHQLTDMLLRSNRSEFRHVVCTLKTATRFSGELRRAGVEIYTLSVPGKYSLVLGVARLCALAHRMAPQIIHATLYQAGVIARTAGWLLRIPVVTTLVNTTYDPEWWLDNLYLNRRRVQLLQLVDRCTSQWWGTRFVALTHGVKQSAARQLGIPLNRIAVIPRGFPFDEITTLPPHEIAALRQQLAGDAYPLLLNVGRLVPQKGQRYLIEAMSRVIRVFPRAHLLIAGEGKWRSDLQALVEERGLRQSVQLLGERRDVYALLAAADMFVFPSLFEGFGVSLLEAMALGRPCVVSDIAVLREVTDGGTRALLAPIRSPDALAEAVIRLAGDREVAGRIGAAAAEWARDQFDIRRCVAAVEDTYRALANQRHGSRPAADDACRDGRLKSAETSGTR
jgi:glycosyltransferase involved in cell wall biosynthesis